MKQLKMCYLRHKPKLVKLDANFRFKNYDDPSEKVKYLRCYAHNDNDTEETELKWFNEHIEGYKDCNPYTDTFFVLDGEEYVAAITAIMHKCKFGYVHMVGVRADYRGRKLSHALLYLALRKLYEQGARCVILTTTDDRLAAVKCYLDAGFLPMVNGLGNKKDAVTRWTKLLKIYGYKKYDMLTSCYRKIKLNLGEDNGKDC